MEKLTEIQSFYKDTTVFLTGASGFLGKIIMEKLLRECKVRKVIILLREKKGKSSRERLNNIFQTPLFYKINSEKHIQRVEIVEGDFEAINLGICDKDVEILKKEVNVIFHCAATVRFDEKLRKAMKINFMGTRYLVRLAKEIKNFKSFIYVSTAYSTCPRKLVPENFAEVPFHQDNVLQLLNLFSDDQIEDITPKLIGDWPNTYTYTKCLSENMIKEEGGDLPIAIVRPSIISGIAKDPLEGWVDNFYGPTGVAFAGAFGVLHTLLVHRHKVADIIPVDFVTNAAIAAGWDVARNKSQTVENDEDKVPTKTKIYNVVSGVESPITWRKYIDFLREHGDYGRPSKAVWHEFVIMTENHYIYRLCVNLFHFFPAFIIDAIAKLIGKEPVMGKLYKKLDKVCSALEYFTTGSWEFDNQNIQNLWKSLQNEDKDKFQFSMASFDWDIYLITVLRGGRKYIIKETPDTIPMAKRRRKVLFVVHYLTVAFLSYLMYLLISFIFKTFSILDSY